MKILIIRFSAIGDIAWTSPVIRCCKTQIPDVQVHFCTKKKFSNLVEYNPYIDKLHYLDKQPLGEFIAELKAENFDYVIDLHGKIRSFLIKLRLGKPTYTYNKVNIRRFLFTKFQINIMPKDSHVVARYMDTVKALGVYNDNKGLDFFVPHHLEINISELDEPWKSGYDVYVIGGSKKTKILPLQKMLELCEKLNFPLILVGGSEDASIGNNLIKKLLERNISLPVFNACGKYNLLQSASIVKQARLVIGHDTGLTHIAAAFGKKIYSIWGPTSPVDFKPYMANNVILENNSLSCRPCSKAGVDRCPKGHHKCLGELPLENVVFDID